MAWSRYQSASLTDFSKESPLSIVSLSELSEGQTATVLVEIQSIRVIRTKKGENMAFLKVSDSKTKLEVTVFSDQYRQFKISYMKEDSTTLMEKYRQEMVGFN